jgi:hypothetical protein
MNVRTVEKFLKRSGILCAKMKLGKITCPVLK